jgi:signal transduction histidine kinase
VEKRYSLVVDLLYVRDRQIGFIIFKSKPSQGAVCEVLRRQISGAFHGVLLLHEREKAEAALEKAYADLKAAQQKLILKERLATLGKLAATVSHEIRNPLGTIRISASAVDRKTRDKGLGVEHALDRIQRNIIRCDNIISELLDYTRMPDLNLKLVSFDQWINRLLDEQILPGGITISREIVPDIKILLDAERFRRVIINLIDNALQAMLELPETSKQIRLLKVQSSVLGNRLKIIIADSGPGIPQDVMPHIFEPLYSTKSTGVGLGLSVVKGIIEQHGGRIKISSKPGKGVKVIVLLPLTQC